MQVALQPDRVLAELARVQVVGRVPRCRPLRRGTEGEVDLERLPAPLRREGRGQRVPPGARAVGRKRHAEVESPSRPAHGDRAQSSKGVSADPRPRWLETARRCFRSGWRRRSPAPAPVDPQQARDPAQRRRRDREPRRDARQERREFRRVGAHGSVPQVMCRRETKPRQEIGSERVAERLSRPPGPSRVLRLLEVVGDGAGVDAQQPELARLVSRRVAGRRLELRLEVLRQPERDGLLRIAPDVVHPAGRIDGMRELVRHLARRGVLIAHDRGEGVPDARQRPDPGEEPEEGG